MSPDLDTSFYFTPRGLGRFASRIAAARAALKAVCDDNPAARESGDSSVWHDNFAFEENQRLMLQFSRRIRELEHVMERACVVEPPLGPLSRAVIGARVTYVVEGERKPRVCEVVGYDEGDPATRRVAYDSPLGRALLGCRAGDVPELVLGSQSRGLEVLLVEAVRSEEVTCSAE